MTVDVQHDVQNVAQAPAKGYMSDLKAFLRLTWPLLLGNTLEWYEFGVYGYVEKEISENFFGGSADGGWFGFAITFVARPMGGFALGYIADNIGRKLSVNLSLGGMIVATVGQGLQPGKYFLGGAKDLGLVFLICCRALQGLSAGGEIGAVSAYLVEVSPVKTLGMAVCMISVGSQIAWAFASVLVALLSSSLTHQQMLEWGWRIPFLISAIPGAISMWGRNRIPETDTFLEIGGEGETSRSRFGFLELLKEHRLSLLVGFGACFATATMWFAPPFWTVTAVLELESADNLWVGNSCQLIGLAVTPVAAMVTDRYGVGFCVLVGAIYVLIISVPTYTWIAFDPTNREVAYVGLGLLFGVAQGFCGATIYLFCAELFPARLRAQGMSLSYNICLSFIGGFAASISQSLQNISPHWAPGIYWAATGAISIASVLLGVALHKKGFLTLGHRRSQPFFGYVAAVEEKDTSVEDKEIASC